MQFAGQLADSTGMYNLRARTYDPATGRFTAPDSFAVDAQEPLKSLYVYANDRPTELVDPSGLMPADIGGDVNPSVTVPATPAPELPPPPDAGHSPNTPSEDEYVCPDDGLPDLTKNFEGVPEPGPGSDPRCPRGPREPVAGLGQTGHSLFLKVEGHFSDRVYWLTAVVTFPYYPDVYRGRKTLWHYLVNWGPIHMFKVAGNRHVEEYFVWVPKRHYRAGDVFSIFLHFDLDAYECWYERDFVV
jgi:RHS repeat-associated protein